MAGFKVKYRTRVKLQRAIQQEIRKLGLVDTRAMEESIRVSAVTGTLGNVVITVNAVYYYVFQDLGAPRANVRANDITERALRSSNGQKFLQETYQAYVTYIDENYNILDTANLVLDKLVLTYELFGDESGRYNGFYDPNMNLKV